MLNLSVAAELEVEQLASLFQLLADKTRLSIVLSLVEGERNVSSLCSELALPQPTVSHHLGLLRVSQIIVNRRKGKQVYYSLNHAMGQTEGSTLGLNSESFSVRIHRKQEMG